MKTLNLDLRVIPSEWKTELLRVSGHRPVARKRSDEELDRDVYRLLSASMSSIPPSFRREIEHYSDKSHYDGIRASRRRITKRGAQLRYSFEGFDRRGCIFIHVPKAAGESVAVALFGNAGAGHLRAYELHMVFGPDFRRYVKFAFVRNPFDRLVSAFEYLRAGGHPAWEKDRKFSEHVMMKYDGFAEFVDDMVARKADFSPYRVPHFYPQTDFLMLDGRLAIDYLGYFETLAEDFKAIVTRLGLKSDLPHRNASSVSRPACSSYFVDRRIRDQVIGFYAKDFAVLGYSDNCSVREPIRRVRLSE